jgi:glycosyltransferase involved in cell wall biosynthesis
MNDQSAPRISIIVAVFNGAKTLQQCIDNVTLQTYPNKELIIIDGGSKDGTVDLLKANREQISYWISEPDHGIYNAWNKGLAMATGEWICFLGADDYFWGSQVLERMSVHLEKLPSNIRVAYGKVMIVNEGKQCLYLRGEHWENVKERFAQAMCIPHIGTMHRRSLFEQHGKYDESFRIAGDYELLLRELKKNNAYFIEDVIVVAMRIGGVSWVVSNFIPLMRETRRAVEMHSNRLPGWFRLIARTRAYVKLLLWRLLGERLATKALVFYWRLKRLPQFWTKT